MINEQLFKTLMESSNSFREQQPFPYVCIDGFLTEHFFSQLLEEFPSLEHFEKHEGIQRKRNRSPHNRYYLSYKDSIYHQGEMNESVLVKGIIEDQQLTESWYSFLSFLQGEVYLDLLESLFGRRSSKIRFAWHCTSQGESVSPHVDGRSKLGTHSFYFTTSDNWNESWGGHAWILGDPSEDKSAVEHFGTQIKVPMLNNKSMLFERSAQSWHGVKPLECPSNVLRKAFFVIAMK